MVGDADVGWDDGQVKTGIADPEVIGPIGVGCPGVMSSDGLSSGMNYGAIFREKFRRILGSNIVIAEEIGAAQSIFVVDVVVHFAKRVSRGVYIRKTSLSVY